MSFVIPNQSAAAFAQQAAPDATDIDAVVAAFDRTGVISGCAVTAQGTPDGTVAVAAGRIAVLGIEIDVTAGNLAVGNGHATLDRRDIIVVSNAAVKSVVAGVAAASPVKPAIPANSVLLAEVYVPATDNIVNANQIIDKGVDLGRVFGVLSFEPVGVASVPYSVVVDEATTNVITNPSFEVDTAGWGAIGASTRTRDVTQKWVGDASLKIAVTAASQGTTSPSGAAAAGQSWTASLSRRFTAAGWAVRIEFLDSGMAQLLEVAADVLLGNGTANQWKRASFTGVAPANTAFVRIRIYSTGADVKDLYIDAVQLEQKDHATTYCDGSIGPGYAWTGTAHASTSTRTAGTKVLGRATGDSFYLGQGRMLGSTSNTTLGTISTTSATPVDTGIEVPIIAPASGVVIVVLCASTRINPVAAVTNYAQWYVREGSNTLGQRIHLQAHSTDDSQAKTITSRFKVTGLTPGTKYTLKWAHSINDSSSATHLFATPGVDGPAVMEVWEALGA